MNSVLLEEAIELFDNIRSALPQGLDLSTHLRSAETYSIAIGGGHTCDIFRVEIPWNENIKKTFNSRCDLTENERKAMIWKVAVKKARIHLLNSLDREGRIKFMKRHAREVFVWSTLEHPNILPLLGYIEDETFVVPSLITPWMENGTAREYLRSNRNVYTLVNVTKGFTEGLCYLHSKGIRHGDLKADNILVSSSGAALIADFGISRTINSGEFPSLTTSSHSSSGTLRWMARELITGDNHNERALSSDIWSYGMTVYEFLTGKIPFQHTSREPGVIRAIDNCDPPYDCGNPPSFTSKAEAFLMKICEFCWIGDPEMRPTCDILMPFFSWPVMNLHDLFNPPSLLTGLSDGRYWSGGAGVRPCISPDPLSLFTENYSVSPMRVNPFPRSLPHPPNTFDLAVAESELWAMRYSAIHSRRQFDNDLADVLDPEWRETCSNESRREASEQLRRVVAARLHQHTFPVLSGPLHSFAGGGGENGSAAGNPEAVLPGFASHANGTKNASMTAMSTQQHIGQQQQQHPHQQQQYKWTTQAFDGSVTPLANTHPTDPSAFDSLLDPTKHLSGFNGASFVSNMRRSYP